MCDLLKVIICHIYIKIRLPFEKIRLCWNQNKNKLVVCVSSCCISPQWAASVRRVCQWLEQPVTFSDCQHTRQPPVTSSALTWHVKTPLKAFRHPPVPARLFLDAHEVHTHLLTYHTIKPLKALSASWQPYVRSHMPLRCQLSCPHLPPCPSVINPPPNIITCKDTQQINRHRLDWWPVGPSAD